MPERVVQEKSPTPPPLWVSIVAAFVFSVAVNILDGLIEGGIAGWVAGTVQLYLPWRVPIPTYRGTFMLA